MLTIDEGTYPIVSVQFETAATLADTEHYLSCFDHWLSRKRPFGVIVQQSGKANSAPVEPDTEQIAAVHRLTLQWAKQNKSKIAQFCVGMALVVDDTDSLEDRRKTAPKTIAAIYGCPGQVFATKTESQQWLQQHL